MMMAASAGPAAGPAFPWWIVVVAIGAVVLLSD
jgi:hypothetical protein